MTVALLIVGLAAVLMLGSMMVSRVTGERSLRVRG